MKNKIKPIVFNIKPRLILREENDDDDAEDVADLFFAALRVSSSEYGSSRIISDIVGTLSVFPQRHSICRPA